MTKKKGTFATQFKKLESVTKKFESGDIDLEDALDQFEKGMKIAAELRAALDTIEQNVAVVKKKYDKELPF
jgi:exodeoxyribonuclease VII small subunit